MKPRAEVIALIVYCITFLLVAWIAVVQRAAHLDVKNALDRVLTDVHSEEMSLPDRIDSSYGNILAALREEDNVVSKDALVEVCFNLVYGQTEVPADETCDLRLDLPFIGVGRDKIEKAMTACQKWLPHIYGD